MRPQRLSLDPNSPSAGKEWKHWIRTFENYLASLPERAEDEIPVNKLHLLTNSVAYDVYDSIEECVTYESAIRVLENLYVQTPNEIFARHLLATAIKNFLSLKGVATSHSSIYHPEGNSQVERSIGSIWRTVKFALKARHLPINRWESVIPEVLHSLRSLLCTVTNATPHELFFRFQRKTFCGPSLPTWLMHPGPVLVRNFTRGSKHDDLVQQAELTHANPAYA